MKIGVVGFGAASVCFIDAAKNSGDEIIVFVKSKDIYSSSLSGIRSDGKLFVSASMGGDIEADMHIQKQVVDFWLNHSAIPKDKIEKGFSFKNYELYKKFYAYGFDPVTADFFHIGTDCLAASLASVYNDFCSFKNIKFNFNSKVEEIIVTDSEVIITVNGEKIKLDKCIVGVGRSGYKLVNETIKKYPKLVLSNTQVDLGVRFELPNHIVEDLNKEMYEFKLKLKTQTGYTARTFCNNPGGFVVIEKYDDFVTVNGHAKMNEKTDNTNFAILVSHIFTEPFNDPVGYGSYISKLSNILAGGQKVILQSYSDLKKSKRTKKIGRVKPTLEESNFILGDLNLVFPRKTIQSIIDFIEKLNQVIPGIAYPDNLLYGVEAKFYGNKINNECFENLKFIGDCSGWTRSIVYAGVHGIIVAGSKGIKALA